MFKKIIFICAFFIGIINCRTTIYEIHNLSENIVKIKINLHGKTYQAIELKPNNVKEIIIPYAPFNSSKNYLLISANDQEIEQPLPCMKIDGSFYLNSRKILIKMDDESKSKLACEMYAGFKIVSLARTMDQKKKLSLRF